METLEITLPKPLHVFVEEEVAAGNYGTASEYVEALIREARQRRDQDQLESLLLEGLDSGAPIAITPEYWEKKRAGLIARHEDGASR